MPKYGWSPGKVLLGNAHRGPTLPSCDAVTFWLLLQAVDIFLLHVLRVEKIDRTSYGEIG